MSILHEKHLSCILATSQEQHAKKVDALKKYTHSTSASKHAILLEPGKEEIMAFEVFISYAHEDQAFCKELDKHLSNLKRQQLISAWYDGDIMPGTEWQPQIMHHLQTDQIILLLISADFMASDFCYSIEMTQAMDRHRANQARVIPIILRPPDWKGAPFAGIEALPKDGKPVTRWPTHDDAFEDIVLGIRKAIKDLTAKGSGANP